MNKRIASLFLMAGMAGGIAMAAGAPSLSYLGRSTIRIESASGLVVYVDPYGEGDYSKKADLVLITHGHSDHNALSLVTLAEGAVVAGPAYCVEYAALKPVKDGDAFELAGVKVRAVAAYNKNHRRAESVGFLITVDGVVVYHSGDTSTTLAMPALAAESIDYALFCTDGYWNMGGEEAGRCADAVKARFVAAIHSSPDGMYDKARAAKLDRPNVIQLPPGTTIALEKRD